MKKNAVIFGAATIGKACFDSIKSKMNVLFFVDNNYEKHKNIPGLPQVLAPATLKDTNFDILYIAVCKEHIAEEIYAQCINELGISEQKITTEFSGEAVLINVSANVRIRFMEQFARYAYLNDISGSVAELGVYRGDFAKEINRAFPDRRLYLFDTFEGFNENDLINDEKYSKNYNHMEKMIEHRPFTETSVDIVLNNLPFPEKAIIKKGYFPDTFDIEDEQFCFVNIDADLYNPIKSGLELFYPKMRGG